MNRESTAKKRSPVSRALETSGIQLTGRRLYHNLEKLVLQYFPSHMQSSLFSKQQKATLPAHCLDHDRKEIPDHPV